MHDIGSSLSVVSKKQQQQKVSEQSQKHSCER